MTKQEFVDAVASKSSLSRRDASAAVDAFLDVVTDTLKSGDTITFTGFGKFSTAHRAAREGVNPRNPAPEGAHPGRDGAEVLGRKPAQVRRQGLLSPAEDSRPRGPADRASGTGPSLSRLHTNICSPRLGGMQLAFDAADRLVELVESRRGPVAAEEAARALYALRHVPAGLARELLDDVVDGDARLTWRGALRRARPIRPGATLLAGGRRPTSSSTSRRPACGRAARRSARSAPCACAGSSSRRRSRRSSTPGSRCRPRSAR